MSLELLTQADYVLNSCGRPVPPKGFKFVDLPKIIPFHHTPQATGAPPTITVLDELNHGWVLTGVNYVALPVYLSMTNTTAPTTVTVTNTGTQINVAINISSFGPDELTNTAGVAKFNATPGFSAVMVASIYNAGSASTIMPSNVFSPVLFQAAGSVYVFTEGWPTQDYLSNNSNTLFLCRGIMLQTDPVSVRLKWPNGRYWNQFPSGNPFLSAGACFPQGTGGNLYALDEEVPIEKGSKVAIEMSGPNVGNVDVHLWGVLRYLLKDNGPSSFAEVNGKTCIVGYPSQAQTQGPPACLVGYPVAGIPGSGSALIKTMPDPIQVLKYRRRFHCWPNGNIFAPEFRLGNQCETDTPPGCRDESYTFFSAPIVVPGGGQNYSNPVAVPGQDDVVIRRWRASIVWNDGSTGTPVVQIRLPNGYSVTGGDQIPLNLGYWMPMFPTLRVATGTSFFLDVSDSLAGDGGSITVTFEFDAVKRRKLAA